VGDLDLLVREKGRDKTKEGMKQRYMTQLTQVKGLRGGLLHSSADYYQDDDNRGQG